MLPKLREPKGQMHFSRTEDLEVSFETFSSRLIPPEFFFPFFPLDSGSDQLVKMLIP